MTAAGDLDEDEPHPSPRLGEADAALLRRLLLAGPPVAALSTLHRGRPAVSMVPFALLPDASALVLHVSRLATHTGDMKAAPDVALLVTGTAADAPSPLALPRVSLQGRAAFCEPSAPSHDAARAAYLARLPEAEELFAFADFSLVLVVPRTIRFVAGFGRAHALAPARLQEILTAPA